MATYTDINGVKLITTGDEAGTWGSSTNTNLEIIERAANGFAQIALTGTSYTLTLSNQPSAAENGHYKAIEFTGTPGGTCTVTLAQNDHARMYMFLNSTNQTVSVTQGSGSNVTIAASEGAVVLADGAGSGAAVKDLVVKAGSYVAGSIVNADINASAAIADTKLDTISTSSKVSNSATTATNANTASAIVSRDGSGNFSAGTITATLSGNATSATSATSATTLSGLNASVGELNIMDGDTSATSTTVAAADRVVFNDNGTMKQVAMSDIATYTSAQVTAPNNATITISAGDAMTGGGDFTTNQSGNETITVNHEDTSSQASVDNSGSTYIQDITLDTYGHVTGITSTDASSTVSPVFASNSVHQAATSITVAAGMYMISCFSTATSNSGQLNLPTTNITFGMINLIKTSTNTQNALATAYLYDGSNWRSGSNTSSTATGVPITNSTSGTQNVSFAWGFMSFSGASTLDTNNANTRITAVRVG